MAKGFDKHQQRHYILSEFGKDLARRSGSRCELCETAHTALRPYEVPPIPHEPHIDQCIFICDDCRKQIDSPKHRDNDYLRCLNRSAWSEIPAIQVMAIYLLQSLSKEIWAEDLLDQLYLTPEVEQWLDQLK